MEKIKSLCFSSMVIIGWAIVLGFLCLSAVPFINGDFALWRIPFYIMALPSLIMFPTTLFLAYGAPIDYGIGAFGLPFLILFTAPVIFGLACIYLLVSKKIFAQKGWRSKLKLFAVYAGLSTFIALITTKIQVYFNLF